MKTMNYRLNSFVSDNKIKEQTTEAFKNLFKIYLEEFKEDAFDNQLDKFDINNAEVSEICFQNISENENRIKAEICFSYFDEEKEGYYLAYFNENGEIEDDFLVFE